LDLCMNEGTFGVNLNNDQDTTVQSHLANFRFCYPLQKMYPVEHSPSLD
jgi:hypothetical protein